MNEVSYTTLRHRMVQEIAVHAEYASAEIGKEALSDRVMEAMGKVPRHEFVPAELEMYAYINRPLPIGHSKTISQPFIVALMTDLLDVHPDHTVLEVGTGLGYQAAILAELATKVYSVEIIEELEVEAKKRLKQLGYANVETRLGDGGNGWPEHAPFDAVLVTAAPELIPPSLLNQIKPGGKMVIPAGAEMAQDLILVEKDESGRIKTKEILPVLFSPLVTSH